MTYEEALQAARDGVPVIHKALICGMPSEIGYRRIVRVGIEFKKTDDGFKQSPYAVLDDYSSHSVTEAELKDVYRESEVKALLSKASEAF